MVHPDDEMIHYYSGLSKISSDFLCVKALPVTTAEFKRFKVQENWAKQQTPILFLGLCIFRKQNVISMLHCSAGNEY